jgi:uncharacterized membrane protein YhiD involved in acid resistance
MLEGFFSGSGFYEFPSFEVAVFSLLLAFILSTVISVTYKLTYKGDVFPNHLFQAIILGAIVTCMIMMAVGDNFAVGFGIIGAVAIIRFRTLISDPRNIIFMFSGISIGIATGVYGYSIAIAGSIIFSLVAFLLSYSKYGKFPESEYEITADIDNNCPPDFLDKQLENYCVRTNLIMQRNSEEFMRKRYTVKLKKDITTENVFSGIIKIEGVKNIRIEKTESRIRL